MLKRRDYFTSSVHNVKEYKKESNEQQALKLSSRNFFSPISVLETVG